MANNLNGIEVLESVLCSDGLIHFDSGKSGTYFSEDGLHIGLRLAFDDDIACVTHEISHFVEIEDERLLYKPKNWGFHYPTIDIPFKPWTCYNFLTNTATLRELRTIAFQHNFEKHLKVNEQSTYESISSLVYMPDFFAVQYDEKIKEAYEKELEGKRSSKMPSELARLKWLEDKLIEFIKMERYSYDSFMQEFERKKKVILAL